MNKFLRKNKYDIAIGVLVLVLVFFFYEIKDEWGLLSDRESFEQFIASFGVWAPIIIITFIITEVIVAPLPGFIPAVSAGFIFGAVEGSIYTYIGNVLGSLLVFWISRRFGRVALEKIFSSKRIAKYEKAVRRQENILLAFYFFPLLPLDIISGVFGLSGISFKKFATVISIGFIFYVITLNLFGDYLARLYFTF